MTPRLTGKVKAEIADNEEGSGPNSKATVKVKREIADDEEGSDRRSKVKREIADDEKGSGRNSKATVKVKREIPDDEEGSGPNAKATAKVKREIADDEEGSGRNSKATAKVKREIANDEEGSGRNSKSEDEVKREIADDEEGSGRNSKANSVDEAKKILENYCIFVKSELCSTLPAIKDKIEIPIRMTLDWLRKHPDDWLVYEIESLQEMLESIIERIVDGDIASEDRGSLQSANNPSGAMILDVCRLCDAQFGGGLGPLCGSDGLSGGDLQEEVQAFILKSGLDERATEALSTAAPEVQRAVIARGSVAETRSPSAAVMGRLRDAQSSGGGGMGGMDMMGKMTMMMKGMMGKGGCMGGWGGYDGGMGGWGMKGCTKGGLGKGGGKW